MQVTFFGAAGEVTGSCHLLEARGRRLLLDCGLFQGSRDDHARNAERFPFDPASIDAVVLSHAHLDHCGRLPLLVRAGFRGAIHTHAASIDLARVLLRDAAHLEAADVERENRRRDAQIAPPLKPLFDLADVERTLRQMRPMAFGEVSEILPGIVVELHPAGHILGAASISLTVGDGQETSRLVFSGDIGQDGTTLLPDPEPPRSADAVLMESTYGDRNHRSLEETLSEIGAVLDAAWDAGGNLLIPSFAIGRAQELLALFAMHRREWRLDRWRIFLDSPMAIEATGIHQRHAELFRESARPFFGAHELKTLLPNLHQTPTAAQSMRLNDIRHGALIIAGSGMCTGGRILHHLRHNLSRPECHVMIVGYQAHGTLGRRLVEGDPFVRIYGRDVPVAAAIHTIGGLSAHAGQDELSAWYGRIEGGPPVYLVHGETQGRAGLARRLVDDHGTEVMLPNFGDRIELGA